MTRKINNKKRVIKKFHQQRQIACTRLWMLDHSMEERITTSPPPLPPPPSSIEFSERTSGLDCIGEGDGRGQAVDNIDPLPPSLSLDLAVPSVVVRTLSRKSGSIFFRDKRHRPVFLTLEISARWLVNVCLF